MTTIKSLAIVALLAGSVSRCLLSGGIADIAPGAGDVAFGPKPVERN